MQIFSFGAAIFLLLASVCFSQTNDSTRINDTTFYRKGNGAMRIGLLAPVFSTFFEGSLGGKYWTSDQTAISGVISIYAGTSGDQKEKFTSTGFRPDITNNKYAAWNGRSQIQMGGVFEYHFFSNKTLSPFIGGLGSIGFGWFGSSRDSELFMSDGDTNARSVFYSTKQEFTGEANFFLSLNFGGLVGVEYFPAPWCSIVFETGLNAELSGSAANTQTRSISKNGRSKSQMPQNLMSASDIERNGELKFDLTLSLRPGLSFLIYLGREGTKEFINEIFRGNNK
ncbi:MAG: hypothetical protein MUF71_22105 [Candidatus Kapabacteria bacterium]|jgi:hypothetical protein|nr:hypothetical protein [Candidatus Kapabacteria bacterium]